MDNLICQLLNTIRSEPLGDWNTALDWCRLTWAPCTAPALDAQPWMHSTLDSFAEIIPSPANDQHYGYYNCCSGQWIKVSSSSTTESTCTWNTSPWTVSLRILHPGCSCQTEAGTPGGLPCASTATHSTMHLPKVCAHTSLCSPGRQITTNSSGRILRSWQRDLPAGLPFPTSSFKETPRSRRLA